MNERSVKLPYHVIFDFVKFLSKGKALRGFSSTKKHVRQEMVLTWIKIMTFL